MDIDGHGHGADPGWNVKWWRMMLPFLFPPLMHSRMTQSGPGPRIVLLRQMFLAFAAGPVLFLPILAILLPLRDPLAPTPGVVTGLLIASAGSLLAAQWSARRTPACGDETTMADTYRKHLFLGIAFANAASLYGFVASFIAMGYWPYLVTLPLGLLGLRAIAPTAANLERADQRLMASGCANSLRAALYAGASPPS